MQREHATVQCDHVTWTSTRTHAKQSCHTLSIFFMMLTRTGVAMPSFRFSAARPADSSVVCVRCRQWPCNEDRCSSRERGKSPSRRQTWGCGSGKSAHSLHFCGRSCRTFWWRRCCCRCQTGCWVSSSPLSCFRCCWFRRSRRSPYAARFECGPTVPQLGLGGAVPASFWAVGPGSSSHATCQRSPGPWLQHHPGSWPHHRKRLDHALKPLLKVCGSARFALIYTGQWSAGTQQCFI